MVRSPSKPIELVVGARWFGDWTSSSPMAIGLGSSSSDEWLGEVIVDCASRIVVLVGSTIAGLFPEMFTTSSTYYFVLPRSGQAVR